MTTIGHNHIPLVHHIFSDPSISIQDVLSAVVEQIKHQHGAQIDTLSTLAASLAANNDRLPNDLNDDQLGIALDLLGRLKQHEEQATELRELILSPLKETLKDLQQLCAPLDSGHGQLESALRTRIEGALSNRLSEYNSQRTAEEKHRSSMTYYGPNGSSATITVGSEVCISDPAAVPAEYCVPDLKRITVVVKQGKIVPGVASKTKNTLRFAA